jgi:hypothetical protein
MIVPDKTAIINESAKISRVEYGLLYAGARMSVLISYSGQCGELEDMCTAPHWPNQTVRKSGLCSIIDMATEVRRLRCTTLCAMQNLRVASRSLSSIFSA